MTQQITINGSVQFKRGLKANLPTTGKPAEAFFCTDTGELYVWDNGAMHLIAATAGGGPAAWVDITGKPTFAPVATSGSYTDLANKPALGTAAAQPSTAFDAAGAATAAQAASLQKTSNLADLPDKAAARVNLGVTVPLVIKTNGNANGSQAVLNLKAGANVVLADDGAGGVTIAASGGSGGGPTTWGLITGTITDQGDLAAALSGKAAASHTHTKSQVTDLGTIGTAAALNVPASGNAAAGEVVKGSDTRLTDSRTPSAHVHAESEVTGLVADLAAKVPATRTINGHALSADVTVSKADVALGNCDNTSDVNKPVSTATAAAIAAAIAGLGATNFADDETPTGLVNGANTAYTLLHTPVAGSDKGFLDGQRLKRGVDYTISGAAITFLIAPPTDSILTWDYRY